MRLWCRALELSGDRSEDALYHRGKILAYQGHHQAAIAAYQRLISLNPARGDGYRELGLSLIDLGRLGEAQELLQAALRQDANDLGALHRLQYATAAQRAEEARPDLHVDFVTFASGAHRGLARCGREGECMAAGVSWYVVLCPCPFAALQTRVTVVSGGCCARRRTTA